MKVKIDQDLCIACGICESNLPEVFSLASGDTAEVILEPVPEELWEAVRQTALDCPEGAILIEEEEPTALDSVEIIAPEEETCLEKEEFDFSLEEVALPEETSIIEETTAGAAEVPQELAEVEINEQVIERKEEMKAIVDPDLCIGCGICEGIVPEVFSLATEPYAVVLLDPIPEEYQDATREAAEECPEAAITIEE